MSSSPISVANENRRPESVCELTKGSTPPSASKLSVSYGQVGSSDTDSAAGDDMLQQQQQPQRRVPRRTSLQVMLPKLPSSESLNNSPGPASPGISNWTPDGNLKVDGTSSDKSLDPTCKLTRKESYKAQRKTYRKEKKRVAHELLCSLQDPAVVVLADWLKVRGTLKSWTKLWCVLKPGLMLLYKSPKTKSNHWVGTVLLSSCQVIERPSKKDGFCFKLFHPMEQSIWAPRGPDKETIGAVVQPLPTSYLIFRAPSQAAGKCWLDALELSLRCSALLVRSVSGGTSGCEAIALEPRNEHETQWSEADYEKHFNDHDLDADSQLDGTVPGQLSGIDSDTDSDNGLPDNENAELDEPPETPYLMNTIEEFGNAGEQVEELPEEHKSLIWFLVKQVRPGMDLSKVVLPTFILEPRSFLDKLSDSYYHADYLSKAVQEDDAYTRMKTVTQWYLSGLYKKPRGLKKPYNPILGETFRCYWQHPNGSRTFYIAEQVSHHPPVSAFYVTNRQDGFCISASILAKSKFYGNSTSAILDGAASLTLLPRGETYTLTVPYAHCKGILMGTLTMELGGKVAIDCEKTGYRTEIEFKLKPFLGGAEQTNAISGKLKLGKETLSTIWGHWDGQINIKDSRTGEEQVLFNPTPETRANRLKRYTVAFESQGEFESERLWQHVSAAIYRDDQLAATEEKTVLEEAQRARTKERKATCTDWVPHHFQQDMVTGQWHYRHADLRPWDPRNDVIQYEYGYLIQTKTRHQTPMIRTTSIISVDPQVPLLQAESRSSLAVLKTSRRALSSHRLSGSSSPEHESIDRLDGPRKMRSLSNEEKIMDSLNIISASLDKQSNNINRLQRSVEGLTSIANQSRGMTFPLNTVIIVAVCAIVFGQFLYWFMARKT